MAVTDLGLGALGGNFNTASLLYPWVSQAIIQSAMPNMVGRQVLAQLPSPNYPVVSLPVQGGNTAMVASRRSEGVEIPCEVRPINPQLVSVYEIGHGIAITDWTIRYAQLPIIQQYMIDLGNIMGNTVDVDCQTVIGAGADSSNAVTATGESLGMNGTPFILDGTIGQLDLVAAKANIMANKHRPPDTIMVNAVGWGMISKLPMYHAEFLYGKPAYENGEMGFIEGMRVLVSQNVPSGTAIAMTTGTETTEKGGQFSPAGYFVESLPLTTSMTYNGNKMQNEMYAIHDYCPAVTKSKAISKITYTGTS